jgi:hypothetical protein
LHRAAVVSPQAITLNDGTIFVTYSDNYGAGPQILIWANLAGTILREDTLNLSNITFLYPEDMRAMLVEFHPYPAGQQTVIDANLHPFGTDGVPQTIEPLYHDTLAIGIFSGGAAYDFTNGELKMLIGTVQPATSPVEYRLRILRHTPGNTVVYDAFDPGPIPINHFATYWSIATGPWNMSVIGFVVVQTGGEQQVWFEGVDQNGMSSGMVHIIPVPADEAANGVFMLADGLTVYATYTLAPLPGGPAGGAYLTAFPLDEILAAGEPPQLQPASFQFSAYPNPFNPSVRLNYELAAPGPVILAVYDVEGRLVQTLVSEMQSAGSHYVLWNAQNLPSGVYLARVSAGPVSRVQKLMLMK